MGVGRMSNVAIVLDHMRVVRGGHEIVPDLSLVVPKGSVFGLVGPSGSGKTTVIRAILGLTRVAGGQATVLGHPAGSAVLRPDIGYMPQGEGIYTDLSARANLEFFAAINRVAKSRVDVLLDLLDIASIADRRADTYSGGQRQRVGLAIALLREPPLLILDEPTVGLDPRLRNHLWSLFRQWAEAGTTLLISTHVMDEAAKCDEIAFLSDGRLVALGSPEALQRQTGTDDLEDAVLALSERSEAGHVH